MLISGGYSKGSWAPLNWRPGPRTPFKLAAVSLERFNDNMLLAAVSLERFNDNMLLAAVSLERFNDNMLLVAVSLECVQEK